MINIAPLGFKGSRLGKYVYFICVGAKGSGIGDAETFSILFC